jgi:cell division protein FtsB
VASSRRRSRRSPLVARAFVLLGVALVLVLYYRPVKSYLSTSKEVAQRQAEVRQLRVQNLALQHKLELAATREELAREARRLGYVRPGERLYIVKGIATWRASQAALTRSGH